MRADYDSQADAIEVYLVDHDEAGHDEAIDDGTYCTVTILKGEPVGLQILHASAHSEPDRDELIKAADRFGLDLAALEATVAAALAAPDQEVRVDLVGAPKP